MSGPVTQTLASIQEEQAAQRDLLERLARQLGDRGVPLADRALLSAEHAADYLDISLTLLRELRCEGRVKSIHVHTSRRYTRESLDAFKAEQEAAERRAALPRRPGRPAKKAS